jgi:hypothetical protein
MHWHAYAWVGNGTDRAREGERRTTSPHFAGSPLPPMRTGDWLAKPATLIAATFTTADAALDWLAEQYRHHNVAFLHPDRIGPEARLELAADLLTRGVDVQWGEWLQAARFTTIAMICCPNRHVPHPCPALS